MPLRSSCSPVIERGVHGRDNVMAVAIRAISV
jgi:hypothetical protein